MMKIYLLIWAVGVGAAVILSRGEDDYVVYDYYSYEDNITLFLSEDDYQHWPAPRNHSYFSSAANLSPLHLVYALLVMFILAY